MSKDIEKSLKIELNFKFNEKSNAQYANDIEVFKNEKNKTLVCDYSSSKEEVLSEIKEQFQSLLKEFSRFLDKRYITTDLENKETELLI